MFQIILYPPDILSPVLCHAHVSRALWTSSTGHVAVSEPSPGGPAVVVATWLESHYRSMALRVAPYAASLGHFVDVYFGLLKPISFIQWLCNGPIGPNGSYPSQTKSMINVHCSPAARNARYQSFFIIYILKQVYLVQHNPGQCIFVQARFMTNESSTILYLAIKVRL